jgi:hypothetical protein
MAARRNVQYSRLSTQDGNDNNITEGDADLRFTYTPKSLRRIPWKSIALAIFLLLGTSLLFLSYFIFIFTGHMEGDNSQAYGLLFLGFLAFLPGMLCKSCHYSLYLGLKIQDIHFYPCLQREISCFRKAQKIFHAHAIHIVVIIIAVIDNCNLE